MEKKFKGTKFSQFLKKNIYLILMIVCLLAIIAMIAYSFTKQNVDNSTPTSSLETNDGNNNDLSKPPQGDNNNQNTDNNNNNNNSNNGQNAAAILTKIYQPMVNVEIIQNYTDSELVFNATMKHWATHQAVDYKAEVGQNVLAVFDGEVISINTTTLRGTTVTVKHSNGFESVYSLLDSNVKVKVGQKVKKGDVLGTVAESGIFESADGPHLHFEFKKDGSLVDPNYYFDDSDK